MTATYVCGTGYAVRVVNYGLVYEFEGSFELSFGYVCEQGYCFVFVYNVIDIILFDQELLCYIWVIW